MRNTLTGAHVGCGQIEITLRFGDNRWESACEIHKTAVDGREMATCRGRAVIHGRRGRNKTHFSAEATKAHISIIAHKKQPERDEDVRQEVAEGVADELCEAG